MLRRIPLLLALCGLVLLVSDIAGVFTNAARHPLLNESYPLATLPFFLAIPALFFWGLIGGGIKRKALPAGWWLRFMLATLFIIIFAYNYGSLNSALGDWRFHRDEAEFNSVVEAVKSGSIPVGPSTTMFTRQDLQLKPNYVIAIKAAKAGDGVIVMFLISGSGRVHRGYLFKQNESSLAPNARQADASLRQVDGDWYEFAD